MGSGSSNSKPATPSSSASDNKMTQPSSRGSQSRGRRHFEEVEFEDPNASPAQRLSHSEQNGVVSGISTQVNYRNSYGGVQAHDPNVGNYGHGHSGPQDHWQYGGNATNTQQQFVNVLQSHYQQAQATPQLAPQPNQDPDEFLSMALQMQEMVSLTCGSSVINLSWVWSLKHTKTNITMVRLSVVQAGNGSLKLGQLLLRFSSKMTDYSKHDNCLFMNGGLAVH